jgi:hypothetical protein
MMTPEPLPPFSPPADYQVEPELVDPPPRAIPPLLHQGRLARRRRQTSWGFFAAGTLCLAGSQLPIMDKWAIYFVPLAYLSWIGAACLVVGVLVPARALLNKGRFRYVEEGLTTVARVRAILMVTSHIVNGQESTFHVLAEFDYRDPRSGAVLNAADRSRDISSVFRSSVTTSFRVGDHVTLVYLPSDPAGTMRLYGFLDLRPGLGIVDRQRDKPTSMLSVVLQVCAVFAIIFAVLWNVYAQSRYTPLEFTTGQGVVMGLGGVVLGAAMVAALAYNARRTRRRREERNRQAAIAGEPAEPDFQRKRGWFGDHGIVLGLLGVAGSVLIGGLTVLCWCHTANAWFDRSPPQLLPVRIVNMVQVTHEFVFREYFIEYEFLAANPKEKQRFLSTPDEMQEFADVAVAEVQAGWLGWPWVKALHPAMIRQQPQPPAQAN